MDKENGGIQVIARAAAILRAVSHEGMSLGALARATGLPRSTVQRIVDALATEHFVEAGEGGVRLGWGLGQLAQLAQSDIVAQVRPHLEILYDATGESVDLSCRSGREVSFLDRFVSKQELRVVPTTDKPHPLHAMANGKALLSCMSDAQVEALFANATLPSLTHYTRCAMPDLLADLADVRRSGFSYDREEHAYGICAIGVPVQVSGLRAHALSVAVPISRFDHALPDLKTALIAAKASIEQALSRLVPAPASPD